ncbi:related to NAD-dependent aldehyde dehydrogenases [Saccharomycodes ludwigii]|uniref:Succinate-semialdehyde dehydrogenase, mitochondrial n=1 Tax=Saccharomycodes ludwigii TaxID=36035 RepID=A0A376B5R2_9ASCO|nr:hypothetical protein SCDLUD_001594 [Saccharomycodes ludwigii]KAH3901812.1 hypothetical protein SCDLUD_001594 [Saccharomycodes ludwigii]SSD59460.1 related to NAD-dependent aldehyde dehydrogenases [Saccharomycodes ludwigii]
MLKLTTHRSPLFAKLVKHTNFRNSVSRFHLQRYASTEILENKELLSSEAFVNGEWILPQKKQEEGDQYTQFGVSNPSNGENLINVSNYGISDFNSAISIAHETFKETRFSLTQRQRSDMLYRIYELMQENRVDLARLITLENGKPLKDALGEINYSASYFKWFAEEAPRLYGNIIPSSTSTSKTIYSVRQPLGVVGILTPWNFPSAMIARKLAPVIATGNTTVIKPAAETPLSALVYGLLCNKAGVPKGMVNILPTTYTAQIGELICSHELIKKVTFTGSTKIGKLLMEQSSRESPSIKKFSMELGGNAPFIVFNDADIEKALDGVIACKFRQSGQTCICANRIFVQEEIYDEFAKKLVDRVSKFKLGDGFESTVTHGPLIHSKAVEKVSSLVQDAKVKGATVLIGGVRASTIGPLFYHPTVITDVNESMHLFNEEIFGPVAPLIKFKTVDEVIERANSVDVGLAGYAYSTNLKTIHAISQRLETGMIGINNSSISDCALPFGGVKNSGLGREGSLYGINDYTEVKSVVLDV